MQKSVKFLPPPMGGINIVLILFIVCVMYLIRNEHIVELPRGVGVVVFIFVFCAIVYLYNTIENLRSAGFKSALLNILIAFVWLGVAYIPTRSFVDSYLEFRTIRKEEDGRCREGNARACYNIASSAYSANLYLHASNYYSAACLLKNDEACADLNRLLASKLGFHQDTYDNIANGLCKSGNLFGCTQEAATQIKTGNRKVYLPILEKACSSDIPDACLALGEDYKSSSIIKAEAYLSRACKLDSKTCWNLDYACSNLNFEWWNDDNANELDETLKICANLCETNHSSLRSRSSACWDLERYISSSSSYNEKSGDLLMGQGKLVEAAKYYSRICSWKQYDMLCHKNRNICGRESINNLLYRSSDDSTGFEEKQKALSFCRENCSSGNKNACSGVKVFMTYKNNILQHLMFLADQCKSDGNTCEELKLYCKTSAQNLLIEGENGSAERDKLCSPNGI